MPAPVVASVTTGTASSTASCVVTKPAGVAEGDLLLISLTYSESLSGSAVATLPSGWTSISNPGQYYVTSIEPTMLAKIAGPSEPSSYTVSTSLVGNWRWCVLRITGAALEIPPVTATIINSTSSNGTITWPHVTTDVDDTLIITQLLCGSTPTTLGGTPSGWASHFTVDLLMRVFTQAGGTAGVKSGPTLANGTAILNALRTKTFVRPRPPIAPKVQHHMRQQGMS